MFFWIKKTLELPSFSSGQDLICHRSFSKLTWSWEFFVESIFLRFFSTGLCLLVNLSYQQRYSPGLLFSLGPTSPQVIEPRQVLLRYWKVLIRVLLKGLWATQMVLLKCFCRVTCHSLFRISSKMTAPLWTFNLGPQIPPQCFLPTVAGVLSMQISCRLFSH